MSFHPVKKMLRGKSTIIKKLITLAEKQANFSGTSLAMVLGVISPKISTTIVITRVETVFAKPPSLIRDAKIIVPSVSLTTKTLSWSYIIVCVRPPKYLKASLCASIAVAVVKGGIFGGEGEIEAPIRDNGGILGGVVGDIHNPIDHGAVAVLQALGAEGQTLGSFCGVYGFGRGGVDAAASDLGEKAAGKPR
jgi:hypothetical protein